MEARGLRNNNPGNIKSGPTKWQGMAANQSDPVFVVFETMAYGVRAICKILETYQSEDKLITITQLISRWAPPSENDTPAYVQDVAASAGVNATAPFLVHVPGDMKALVVGIIKHENGIVLIMPELNAAIDQGIAMALAPPVEAEEPA